MMLISFGSNNAQREDVFAQMDAILKANKVTSVFQGAKTAADRYVKDWCIANQIRCVDRPSILHCGTEVMWIPERAELVALLSPGTDSRAFADKAIERGAVMADYDAALIHQIHSVCAESHMELK